MLDSKKFIPILIKPRYTEIRFYFEEPRKDIPGYYIDEGVLFSVTLEGAIEQLKFKNQSSFKSFSQRIEDLQVKAYGMSAAELNGYIKRNTLTPLETWLTWIRFEKFDRARFNVESIHILSMPAGLFENPETGLQNILAGVNYLYTLQKIELVPENINIWELPLPSSTIISDFFNRTAVCYLLDLGENKLTPLAPQLDCRCFILANEKVQLTEDEMGFFFNERNKLCVTTNIMQTENSPGFKAEDLFDPKDRPLIINFIKFMQIKNKTLMANAHKIQLDIFNCDAFNLRILSFIYYKINKAFVGEISQLVYDVQPELSSLASPESTAILPATHPETKEHSEMNGDPSKQVTAEEDSSKAIPAEIKASPNVAPDVVFFETEKSLKMTDNLAKQETAEKDSSKSTPAETSNDTASTLEQQQVEENRQGSKKVFSK